MKEIQQVLFDKLVGTGWDEILRFYIKSADFLEILEKLEYEVQEKRRFTPGIKDLLRPFELCHLDRLKVIFLVSEPYFADPTLNNGLAISCNHSQRLPIELFRLLAELTKQYPKTIFPEETLQGDLKCWALSGVLMLNRSLTSQVGKAGQHFKIWNGFFYYLMNILSRRKDLLFVSFGENEAEDLIGEFNTLIKVQALPDHQDVKFDTQELFVKINEYLKNKRIGEIVW